MSSSSDYGALYLDTLIKNMSSIRRLSRMIPTPCYGDRRPLSISSTVHQLFALRNCKRSVFKLPRPSSNVCLPCCVKSMHFDFNRCLSVKSGADRMKEQKKKDIPEDANGKSTPNEDVENEADLSLYQRFKAAYKTHGKILIVVHTCLSACWFGCFYTIASSGVDIVGLLQSWNFPEFILSRVRETPVGDIAIAYLLYKLASPVRYMATLAGLRLSVNLLRRVGRIPELRDEDRLSNLAKESHASIKEIAKDRKETLMEKYEDRKGTLKEIVEDKKNDLRQTHRRWRKKSDNENGQKR